MDLFVVSTCSYYHFPNPDVRAGPQNEWWEKFFDAEDRLRVAAYRGVSRCSLIFVMTAAATQKIIAVDSFATYLLLLLLLLFLECFVLLVSQSLIRQK